MEDDRRHIRNPFTHPLGMPSLIGFVSLFEDYQPRNPNCLNSDSRSSVQTQGTRHKERDIGVNLHTLCIAPPMSHKSRTEFPWTSLFSDCVTPTQYSLAT